MTKLDSMLEGKDITLPIKVHLVKAMFFPLVMYGCESWTTISGNSSISVRRDQKKEIKFKE